MIDYSERELVLQEQLAQAEQDCDSAYAEIARLEAELADAQAVIDKLPRTAGGEHA